MASYNNAYANKVSESPRYSRNSKMDLEARRRNAQSGNVQNRGSAQTRVNAQTVSSNRNGISSTSRYRNTSMNTNGSRNKVITEGYTAPIYGVRENNTGINGRKMAVQNNTRTHGGVQVEGNTLRYQEQVPNHKASNHRNNTKKAVAKKRSPINPGVISLRYSMFLAAVTLVVAGMSMSFLNVQANVNTKASLINTLQKNIADLSIENDAAYGAVGQNVNMEAVKARALELGMEYIDSAQVVSYEAPLEDTVKQYETIPTSGVLAQSEKTSE